ncbi:MAG: hypothetical protein ACE5GI_07995, partial [Candidatus Aminicenantales bacterium]
LNDKMIRARVRFLNDLTGTLEILYSLLSLHSRMLLASLIIFSTTIFTKPSQPSHKARLLTNPFFFTL